MDLHQKHARMTVFIYALRQTEGFDVGDQKICLFCKLFYQFIHANFLEHQHRLEILPDSSRTAASAESGRARDSAGGGNLGMSFVR